MKKIFIPIVSLLILVQGALAQTSKEQAPENWFNLDYKTNHVYGLSTEKAYHKLLKNKTAVPVIVAVIDGGVDWAHEDLVSVMWVNQKELNGKAGYDDDQNGYIDDIHGWNFIGGPNGSVNYETLELTRLYAPLAEKYDGSVKINPNDNSYQYFLKLQEKFNSELEKTQERYLRYKDFYKQMDMMNQTLQQMFGMVNISAEILQEAKTPDKQLNDACYEVAKLLYSSGCNTIDDFLAKLSKGIDDLKGKLDYGLNPTANERKIVGDNPNDMSERYYGNNDSKGPDASHGTHVAGIIAADRYNNKGIKGVSDCAQIMSVRAVPNGDERDKDVANAIRYAVDNGAKIINMSFGKEYSPNKETVDEAVKYAASKDVLLIHAAGNDGKNTDTTDNFPTKTYLTGGNAPNWIEVGAISWHTGKDLVAPFSNYGSHSVDVFAPGVDIYSTVPNSKYESNSGTSMAAPMAAGVASVLRGYFPDLTAEQVKYIILKSSVKLKKLKVIVPSDSDDEDETLTVKEKFSNLSQTGGIINLYEAVKMAEKMSTTSSKQK